MTPQRVDRVTRAWHNQCYQGPPKDHWSVVLSRQTNPLLFASVLTIGLIIGLAASPSSFADDLPRAVPKVVEQSRASVVALRLAKQAPKKETFRQRWHRLRKEKYSAMNQRGDGTFGAAFFIDDKGHLLTTLGLIQKRESVEVIRPDGRSMQAKVIGRDPRNDVALLKVDAKELKSNPAKGLKLHNKRVKVGHSVFSLGNAFRSVTLDRAVTISKGRVSAIYNVVGQDGRVGRYQGTAYETDASVNPGDYGGPLIDNKGRVVGLITSAYVKGRRQGVIVPAHQIHAILQSLKDGKELKPYLGIEVKPIAANAKGVPVAAVLTTGPAAKAGIQIGDKIMAINGVETNDAMALKKTLLSFPALSELIVTIKRPSGSKKSGLKKIKVEPCPVKVGGVKGM